MKSEVESGNIENHGKMLARKEKALYKDIAAMFASIMIKTNPVQSQGDNNENYFICEQAAGEKF